MADRFKTMKIFCIKCNRDTNHSIKRELRKELYHEEEGIHYEGTWQVVECKGCDEVSFREAWISSDAPFEDVKLFPLRGNDILPRKDYFYVPRHLRSIYRETIEAYNNLMLVLCAGGLRAILEGICNAQKIIDGPVTMPNGIDKRKKDLVGKISGLHEKGFLTKSHAEILHEHRFLGNEALHTLDKPTKKELKIAIEIIEHTLENLYEVPEKALELTWQRTSRKQKK